ncbi:hypothetical protein [Escherichia coli]
MINLEFWHRLTLCRYPIIVDGDEAQEAKKTNDWEKNVTKFMKKWWPKVKDADRRNMVGRYSALLLQVKDNKPWSEPVDIRLVKSLGEPALVKLIPVTAITATRQVFDSGDVSAPIKSWQLYVKTVDIDAEAASVTLSVTNPLNNNIGQLYDPSEYTGLQYL